jgi:c-di-GMP-related signal transduction protein
MVAKHEDEIKERSSWMFTQHDNPYLLKIRRCMPMSFFIGGQSRISTRGQTIHESTASLINNAFLAMDLNDLTSGKRAFINFSRDLLLRRIPFMLPRDQVVVEILERVEPEQAVIEACRELKQHGYLLALDDFVLREDYQPFMELADIIKVEYSAYNESGHRMLTGLFKGKNMLAERVETREEFEAAVSLGYHFFQGYFFSKPIMVKGREIAPFNLILMEMLKELGRPSPNFKAMANGIQRDLSLSYKFLKIANTMQFGSRYRVTTISSALVRMGLEKISKWIYLMLLNEHRQIQNEEMIRKSLIRARMMELAAKEAAVSAARTDYFLVGLFSMLDRILGKPMEKIVYELPLSPAVIDALLGKDNDLRRQMTVIIDFEELCMHSDPDTEADLSPGILMHHYLDAMKWFNKLEMTTETD